MATLYYGDNQDVLKQHIADESVDLVYLDPPFNSAQTYMWERNMESEAASWEVITEDELANSSALCAGV